MTLVTVGLLASTEYKKCSRVRKRRERFVVELSHVSRSII